MCHDHRIGCVGENQPRMDSVRPKYSSRVTRRLTDRPHLLGESIVVPVSVKEPFLRPRRTTDPRLAFGAVNNMAVRFQLEAIELDVRDVVRSRETPRDPRLTYTGRADHKDAPITLGPTVYLGNCRKAAPPTVFEWALVQAESQVRSGGD